jgi:RNA polymerase sigma factor (sigma-70 family)
MRGERAANFGRHILVSRYSGVILAQLDRVFNEGTVAGLDDDKLLKRFVVERDEVAFAALVARHGRMVLGVCRRILHDEHDVEDAFQATFLVLVSRAKAIRNGGLLGHWIFGVAHRVAVRARANAARRYVHEQTLTAAQSGVESPSREGERSELREVLDEELASLPELLSVPLVLCYLEGLTHDEAAERLRWPVGTVRSRLARGRDKLRSRLTRRGLTADDATLTATVASQPVSAILLDATVRVSLEFTRSQAKATALASATATTLAKGVLHAMMISKLKILGAVTLACAFAWGGMRSYALQFGGAGGVVGPAAPGTQGQADDRQQTLLRSVAKIQGDLAESARINAEAQKELNDLRAKLVADGTAKEAQEQIRALGITNIILRSVKPSDAAQAAAGRPAQVLNYGLKYSDYDRIVETIPTIRKILPVREIRKQIRRGELYLDGRVVGTTQDFAEFNLLQLEKGRFLTASDNEKYQNFAVLAFETAKRLFPTENPLNQSVKLGTDYYTVVGVMAERASPAGIDNYGISQDFNKDVYIPLNTCKLRFGERIVDNRSGSMRAEETQLTQITVQVNSTNDVLATADLIKASWAPYHPKKDVEMTVPYDLLLQAQKQARDAARGAGGTTMRGTGMGEATAKDRPRYIQTGQLIVVSLPESNTVTAYSIETGKAKSFRLAKAGDTKLEVQPIVSQGLAALSLIGPNITRIAAFSVLDGTWYAQDLREPADKAVPVVNQNMAAYGIGRRIYAFSPVAKRWDVLELPDGVVAEPALGNDAIICEHNGHLYVFSVKTGKWEDIDTRAATDHHDGERAVK